MARIISNKTISKSITVLREDTPVTVVSEDDELYQDAPFQAREVNNESLQSGDWNHHDDTSSLANSFETFEEDQPDHHFTSYYGHDNSLCSYDTGGGGEESSATCLYGISRQTSKHEDQLMRHLTGGRHRLIRGKSHNIIQEELNRRLRDFKFAQRKRREKYGGERPWGILGLYAHLAGIRTDVEWAEDAAWRRQHQEPYLAWCDYEIAKDTGLNQPFFTYFAMVVCTVFLIISFWQNNWHVEPMRINPMIGPTAQTLISIGAKETFLIVNKNEWWRLISPMVLHAGIIHYFVNMLALWFIGSAIEHSHGFFAAATLFIIPAIGGTILSAIFLPAYISVGASGGIFGLIGACIADIFSNWKLLFSKDVNDSDVKSRFRNIMVLIWLVFDIMLNCVIGLTPFVDNFTHLGGMVYGFLCGLSTMPRVSIAFFGVKTNVCGKIRNGIIRFFGLILSVVFILVTLAILADNGGERISCSNCRYFSCVPFPFWVSDSDKWWQCDDCPISSATIYNSSSSVDLTCPNGEVVKGIDVSQTDMNNDKLINELPSLCRSNCDDLFK